MIVVTNSYLPKSKIRRIIGGDQNPIAKTSEGDLAYYTTQKFQKKKTLPKIYPYLLRDEDESEDDSDREIENMYDSPKESFSGEEWVPNFNDRLTMFIAGTPGAGKSYLAKKMIGLLPKDIPILLFTALEENDGNFDELGTDRLFKIKMQSDILKNISLKEIRKKAGTKQILLLFDDVDKIRDPKISNLTFALMNDALANGRGHEKHDGGGDIHVICTSHSANDYQKTKYSFENSNYVALFPGTTPPLQMYRMFDKLGLDKELCKKMINLARSQKIRSIIIHKVVPMYMIFGNKILLL